jgi:P4 family phage/plasmid primase-like protien
MLEEIKKYNNINLVVFSVDIKQKKSKDDSWKKAINFPKKWQNYTLKDSYKNEKYNGISMLTGKINNVFIIDIDNIEHWNNLLKENNQKEPNTVKVTSGSGGIHLYFKYSDDLENIKSTSKCFGKEYDIDVRTNGGCIIVPPTKYFNNTLGNEVEYKWENNKSIFDQELKSVPQWIKNILSNSKNEKEIKKKDKIKNDDKDKDNNKMLEIQNLDLDIDPEEENLNFTRQDVKLLVDMLSMNKCNNYSDWIAVGMCLHNISKNYITIWLEWSQKSKKYEKGCCEDKWDSFKKEKEGLKIGSLLKWAKSDSPNKYDFFMKKKKINKMIGSKYPNDNLILGDTIMVNDRNYYTHLHNKECFIKGNEHQDMPKSMYVEIMDKFMTIKCRHPECFGKSYPCNHILMNKNETNIAFHGDVNITINQGKDDELVEFQQIDIYEDQELNELVFNSLNGETSQLAKIIYYFYNNIYNFGEDNDWYMYENHKWKNIGNKNMILRNQVEIKLKDLYSKLLLHYKENDYDKNKIKALKTVMKSFGETTQKNNILVELTELYFIKNNKNGDFAKKLDSNKYLIGFNNGVYDLQNFEFREGKSDDYITMTVGYDYQDHHTDKYNGLVKFLEDIQPNKEERDYMLTYLSIGLIGNLLELFTILTGCGRNGKSKLIELLKETLGDYFGSVQSQMFTRPRPDANSPDPGLLSLAKKKIVIASEPEKNSKLNSGFIKFITGRDSTTLRNCHSNDMVDFTAKFITLLICNDIPDCDDIDNAFSKRLRCINFPTEFVMDPTKDNQKKIDTNINDNFKNWKLDFMLLLIDYYKKYKESKELKPTNNILKWTDQYKEETDMYLQFLNETFIETNDDNDKIFCIDLYAIFKDWFKNNNPNAKIPSDREFTKNLRKYKKVDEGIRINDKVRRGIKKHKIREN